METKCLLVDIPAELALLIGKREEGTRTYRNEGSHEEMVKWFEAICEHIGPCVSPGGAAVYAGVTRAGVYKRIKAGRMTTFCFHITSKKKTLFGGEKKLKQLAIVYIPVIECKAWKAEMEERIAQVNAGRPVTDEDFAALEETEGEHTNDMHDFLNFDPQDKKKRDVKYKF